MAKAPLSKKVSDDMLLDVQEHLVIASQSVALIDGRSDSDVLSRARRNVRQATWRLDQLQSCFSSPSEYRNALINGVKMHDVEADLVMRRQNNLGSVMLNGIGRLTTVAQVTTEQLQASFKTYLESPACRIDVTRPMQKMQKMLPKDSVFYPFMAYLESENFPAFRAEALATIAIYLDSGWAERDLMGEIPAGAEGQAVQAFRDMYNDLRSGHAISGGEVKTTMQTLFAFRKMDVKVQAHDKAGLGYVASLASTGDDVRSPLDEKNASAGFVDVVMRDARDPSVIHMATVTSNEDSTSQGDQLARYIQAFQQSMANEVPPFRKGDRLVSQFFSVPLIYTDEQHPGQIAREIVQGLGKRLTFDDRKAINSLALFSQLARVYKVMISNTEGVVRTRHRNFGAAEPFNLPADTPLEDVVRVVADTVAQTMDMAEILFPKLDTKKVTSLITLIKSSAEAAMGLMKAFPDQEKSLSSLTERRPMMEKMAHDLSMNGLDQLEESWRAVAFRASIEALRQRAEINKSRHQNDELKKYRASVKSSAVKAQDHAETQRIMRDYRDGHPSMGKGFHDACVFIGHNASLLVAQAVVDGKISPRSFYEKSGYKYAGAMKNLHGIPVRDLEPEQQDEWIRETVETPAWQEKRQEAVVRAQDRRREQNELEALGASTTDEHQALTQVFDARRSSRTRKQDGA